MATSKKENNLYDLDDVPSTENSSPARIDKPGITHNLKIKCEMVSGDYKNEEAKAKSPDGKWHGFQVTLIDPDNLEFTELYFKPVTKAEDVMYPAKKYELVDGKNVNTRDCTQEETVKVLNNEFLAFLIDVAEAMGYKNAEIREYLYKHATSFEALCNAFLERFKPSENTRVSAKLLYNNSKTKETSYLKLHGSYPVYYPFGNDLLDIYVESRPTLLKLSLWEITNGMVKKYTNDSDAPAGDSPINSGGAKKSFDIGDDDLPF